MQRNNNNNKKKKVSAKPAKRPGTIPAAYNRKSKTSAPRFSSLPGGDGKILVRHTEFVDVVNASVTFEAKSYPLNPGMGDTFPWLANIASNYEYYQFKALRFEYRPSCGTTTAGSVMMAVDFDALDAAPSSVQKMMTYQGAKHCSAFAPCTMECPKLNLPKFGKEKFVRSTTPPANSDRKSYDIGNLYLATDASGGANQVGLLFVTYDVLLSTPHSPDVYPWEHAAKCTTATNSKANPLQGMTVSTGDVEPIVKDFTNNDFLLKEGQYLVTSRLNGTGLSTAAAMNTIFTSPEPTFEVQETYRWGDAAATAHLSEVLFKTAKDATVSFTSPAAWTTLTSAFLRIAPYASDLF